HGIPRDPSANVKKREYRRHCQRQADEAGLDDKIDETVMPAVELGDEAGRLADARRLEAHSPEGFVAEADPWPALDHLHGEGPDVGALGQGRVAEDECGDAFEVPDEGTHPDPVDERQNAKAERYHERR